MSLSRRGGLLNRRQAFCLAGASVAGVGRQAVALVPAEHSLPFAADPSTAFRPQYAPSSGAIPPPLPPHFPPSPVSPCSPPCPASGLSAVCSTPPLYLTLLHLSRILPLLSPLQLLQPLLALIAPLPLFLPMLLTLLRLPLCRSRVVLPALLELLIALVTFSPLLLILGLLPLLSPLQIPLHPLTLLCFALPLRLCAHVQARLLLLFLPR